MLGSAAKIQPTRIQVFQNREQWSDAKAFCFYRNDVIHRVPKTRSLFSEIKKLAIKFHWSILIVRNPAMNSIRWYDANIAESRKRPRNILMKDNDFLSPTEKVVNPLSVLNGLL